MAEHGKRSLEGGKPRGRLGALARRLRSRAAALSHDYARDESGNILIMTAFLAMPIAIGIAVAVDTAEIYRAERNFQQAADAAVLVAANLYSDGASVAEAEAAGQRIFADNLKNLPDSRGTPQFTFPADCSKGNITIAADGEHPLFFPFIHGSGSDPNEAGGQIRIDAAASCPNTSFEIALVVDTSGSMSWTIEGDEDGRKKIDIMKSESKKLATQLFALKDKMPDDADGVRFSVVPFSSMVAVNTNTGPDADAQSLWSESYEDRSGLSSIHHKDLDWTWDTARNPKRSGRGWVNGNTDEALTRYTLYDDLKVTWKGCFQARPYPYSVQDDEPVASEPDSLFVPSFAPDEPDNYNGWTKWIDNDLSRPYCRSWYYNRRRTLRCYYWSDGTYWSRNWNAFPSRPGYNQRPYYINGVYQSVSLVQSGTVSGEKNFINSYIRDDGSMPSDNVCKGRATHTDCSGKRDQPLRQGFTFKYKDATWWNVANDPDYVPDPDADPQPAPDGRGPNYSCYSAPLLPLSDTEETVTDYIDTLQPLGGTNVPLGAVWGWRTLSSRLPFAGKPENSRDNKKIMVLMTDGQNTYYRPTQLGGSSYSDVNQTIYSGYGYGKNHDGVNKPTQGDGFMFDGFDKYPNPGQNPDTWTEAMDSHLTKVCENAKKEQIIVYSIAFDVAEGSSIKTVLETCASPRKEGGKYYFDATSSDKLTAAFNEIADSLKRLRLTK